MIEAMKTPLAPGTVSRPWGFWTTLAWVALALLMHEGFSQLERAVLPGTWLGKLITDNIVLGALNLVVSWSVPLLVLIVAIRLRNWAVRDYFGWVRPRAGHVVLGIVLALAIQLAISGILYLLGASWSEAVEQYRADRIAGVSPWIHVLVAWPAIVCAPIVEESVFRGFLWLGWAQSRLGELGTLFVGSFVFAAWHIPKAMEMNVVGGVVMLIQVLLLGLFFSWLRWRTGGTTVGMFAHATANLYPPLVGIAIGALLA